MIIKHTRESDFKDMESEFDDFHYGIAYQIKKQFTDYPILVDDSGKKLSILIDNKNLVLTRAEKEFGKGCYKITIEKLEDVIK